VWFVFAGRITNGHTDIEDRDCSDHGYLNIRQRQSTANNVCITMLPLNTGQRQYRYAKNSSIFSLIQMCYC